MTTQALQRLNPISTSVRGDKSVAAVQRKCSRARDLGKSVPVARGRCELRVTRQSGWGSFAHLVLRKLDGEDPKIRQQRSNLPAFLARDLKTRHIVRNFVQPAE